MRTLIDLPTLLCIAQGLPATAQREAHAGDTPHVIDKSATVTEVIHLRYEGTAAVTQRLHGSRAGRGTTAGSAQAMPAGIDSIVEEPRTNSLVITGTARAVAGVRKRVEGLDVQSRAVTLTFNVLRFDFDAEGDWDVRVVGRPAIKTLANSPAAISVSGDVDAYTVEITPHVNADGTYVLEGGLRAAGQHSTFKRRVAARTKAVLAGVTDSASASVRKTVAAGRIPSAKGEPFTVFYLQLVSVQEDPPAR